LAVFGYIGEEETTEIRRNIETAADITLRRVKYVTWFIIIHIDWLVYEFNLILKSITGHHNNIKKGFNFRLAFEMYFLS